MKFRSNRNRPAIVEPAISEEQFVENAAAGPGRGRWSTAFLIVGSALMGATALALWNRRTITNLRTEIDAMSASAANSFSKKDEEIF